MKIQHINGNRINIQSTGLQYRPKNKSFRAGEYLAALDFVLSLPDLYIESCVTDVRQWALANDHDVLRAKDWRFA